jgi:nucleoside-diphosphate-sugar epimerase
VHALVRADSSTDRLLGFCKRDHIHVHDGTADGMLGVFEKARPDTIFHLAALYLTAHKPADLRRLIGANIELSAQLFEAAGQFGSRCLVNTGTSWQFNHLGLKHPANFYAATKQASQDLLTYFSEAYGYRASTLALFDTYGPGDLRRKLMSSLWQHAISQQPLLLSPGEQLVDLVYIDDVVNAFLIAADVSLVPGQPLRTFAVSSCAPLSLRALVKTFERVTGIHVDARFGARPYRDREVMVPWSNGELVPGWNARVSLSDGIQRSRPSSSTQGD